MFGNNPIRRPELGSGDILKVQEIFKTIQGEGPYVGYPAIFIRLGGCNLACNFCDTEFESFREINLNEILATIDKYSSYNTIQYLVVITGGEPFRQPIEKLCEKLIEKKYLVQIETNGTLYRNVHPEVEIVCSPKVGKNGYIPIREDLLARINALKFLISHNNPLYQEVPEIGQKRYNIPVYIQPMDENNAKLNTLNSNLSVEISLKFGYKLSIQVHKVLNIK